MSDSDDDFLAQTWNGARNDEESGLYSPQVAGIGGSFPDDDEDGADPLNQCQIRYAESTGSNSSIERNKLLATLQCLDEFQCPPGSQVVIHPDLDEKALERVQHPDFWESFVMSEIAGCTGTVLRHTGDYTLVQFLVGDVKICTTLSRAALVLLEDDDLETEDGGEGADSLEREDEGGSSTSPKSLVGSCVLLSPRVLADCHPLMSGSGSESPSNDITPTAAGAAGLRRRSRNISFINSLRATHTGCSSPSFENVKQSLTDEEKEGMELFDKGNRFFKDREFPKAIECYSGALAVGAARPGQNAFLELCPPHAVLSNRSGAQLASGNWEAAFEDASQAISAKPTSTRGYVRAGNVHRALRQYQQARKMYVAALKLDPTNQEILYLNKVSRVAEVYSKNANLGKVDISWTREGVIKTHAKRSFDTHQVLFWELPLFSVPADAYYTHSVEALKSLPVEKKPLTLSCDNCCRTLVSDELLENTPGDIRTTLNLLIADFKLTECNSGCGALYCTEHCRARALLSFHQLECTCSHANWSKVTRDLATQSALSDTDFGLLRLQLRIVATAVARVRAERPSNHDQFFLELLPSSNSDVFIAIPINENLLTASGALYSAIHASMTSTERSLVTKEHWERVLEVVQANAAFSTCSPWNELTHFHRRMQEARGDLSSTRNSWSGSTTAGDSLVVSLSSPNTASPMLSRAGSSVAKKTTEGTEEQLSAFLASPEAQCCTTQALCLFPTVPHLQRSPHGNVSIHVSGGWRPLVVGSTTRPVKAGEGVSIQLSDAPYQGDTSSLMPAAVTGDYSTRGSMSPGR